MTTKRSFNTPVQIADESAYASEATVDEPLGRVQNISTTTRNNAHLSYSTGGGRRAQSSSYGQVDIQWNFSMELHRSDFLKYAVGARTGSGTDSSKYVFTEASVPSDIPSFTMEIAHTDGTDVVEQLLGCVTQSWTIQGALQGPVLLRASGFASTISTSSSVTSYTEPTTDTFMAHQANVYWGTSPTLIGEIQSWSVTCNNGTVPEREAGSRFVVGYALGRLQYQFSLSVIVSEDAYLTLRNAMYGLSTGPSTAVTSSQMVETDELRILISEGSSSTHRNIELWLDPAFLDSVERSVQIGDDLVLANISGTALGGKSNIPVQAWTVA